MMCEPPSQFTNCRAQSFESRGTRLELDGLATVGAARLWCTSHYCLFVERLRTVRCM